MYQDSHLHIEAGTELEKHPSVGRVFLNSTGPDDYQAVIAAGSSAEVLPFFGLHPWKAAEGTSPGSLEETLKTIPAAGIGESGLDAGPAYKPQLQPQLLAFMAQIKLAQTLERPMTIHCVHAWQQLFACLDAAGPLSRPFILHSFYGPGEILERLLKLGAYISISSLSLRNPAKSHRVISRVPMGRLLIETDMIAGTPGFTAVTHLQELKNNYNVASSIFSISESELISRVWENGTVFTN